MNVTTLIQLKSPDRIHAASTHHIHALPNELLSSIFLYLYRDPSIQRATDDQSSTHKLTFIMLVCKHWKRIVECSPTLWTDIWLGQAPEHVAVKDDWIGWLEALFGRSGTMPLTLTILASFVDLEDASEVLLQHLPRCETLVLQPPEGQIYCLETCMKLSAVHRILSCPLPILREMVIGGDDFHCESDQRLLLLDAPNLRSLSSSTFYIIPFIKPYGSSYAHNSLERFSINGGWWDVVQMLPCAAVSLPELKSLSLTEIEDLWNLLRILHTPNLERLIVNCGLADWLEEIHTPTPVLINLRELTWYTEPGAESEAPNLLHLLQHCPNLEYLLYNLRRSSAITKQQHLEREDVDSLIQALSDSLDETHNVPQRLCPRLKHLHLVCATYEQVRDLVLLRPALECVTLQCRKPGDDIIVQSKAIWREKVDLVRWIRSKIDFEFEEDGVAVGPALQEEEGVFWDPSANGSE